MSYPVPVPALTEEEWEAFLVKLKNFTLTEEQKEFYRDARKRLQDGKARMGEGKTI